MKPTGPAQPSRCVSPRYTVNEMQYYEETYVAFSQETLLV